MDASLSQTTDLTCPQCGRTFTAEIWLIVDGAARPDLLDRVREGTLHDVVCRDCGPQGAVDAPLLFYLPDRESPLVFSPAHVVTSGAL